jgi:hypothetical protein
MLIRPIAVATRSQEWVCDLLLDGVAGSNPAGNVDVSPLRVLSVVQVEVCA